jgi:hypothetical protein
MRSIQTFALASVLSLSMVQSHAASDKKINEQVNASLSSVSVLELAPKAAAIVEAAKRNEKEDVALAAIQFAAGKHPDSIVTMVGALGKVLPESAAALATSAMTLLPAQKTEIVQAALKAAPAQAAAIEKAISRFGPQAAGEPAKSPGNRPETPPGLDNRPVTPPGLVDKDVPGAIRGNRPEIPPGHVRDPKPGRDPQRYARP